MRGASINVTSKVRLNLIRYVCVMLLFCQVYYLKDKPFIEKTILHQKKHGGWIMIEFSYFALMLQRLQRDISITLL